MPIVREQDVILEKPRQAGSFIDPAEVIFETEIPEVKPAKPLTQPTPLKDIYANIGTSRLPKRDMSAIQSLKGVSALVPPKKPETPIKEVQIKKDVPSKSLLQTIKDIPRGVSAGAAGTVAGMAGGIQWLGGDTFIGKIGKEIADTFEEGRKAVQPERSDFFSDVAAGFGSMFTFLIPGAGVAKGLQFAHKIGPRVANWVGASSMAGQEALTEAGSAYREKLTETDDIPEAEKSARVTFWSNLPLVLATNRLGLFADKGKALRKSIISAHMEATQEAGQEAIRATALEKPLSPEAMAYSALIGGLVGGGTSVVLSAVDKSISARQIPPDVKAIYEERVHHYKRLGLADEQANIEATKDISKTPQGQEYLNKVADAMDSVLKAETLLTEAQKEKKVETTEEALIKARLPEKEIIKPVVTPKITPKPTVTPEIKVTPPTPSPVITPKPEKTYLDKAGNVKWHSWINSKGYFEGDYYRTEIFGKGGAVKSNPMLKFVSKKPVEGKQPVSFNQLVEMAYAERLIPDTKPETLLNAIKQRDYKPLEVVEKKEPLLKPEEIKEKIELTQKEIPLIAEKEVLKDKIPIEKLPETKQITLPEEKAKEPWQMTIGEYAKYRLETEPLPAGHLGFPKGETGRQHKEIIQQALSEGKPIPPEVLKNHPELIEVKKPAPLEETEGVDIEAQKAKYGIDDAVVDKLIAEGWQLRVEEGANRPILYETDEAVQKRLLLESPLYWRRKGITKAEDIPPKEVDFSRRQYMVLGPVTQPKPVKVKLQPISKFKPGDKIRLETGKEVEIVKHMEMGTTVRDLKGKQVTIAPKTIIERPKEKLIKGTKYSDAEIGQRIILQPSGEEVEVIKQTTKGAVVRGLPKEITAKEKVFAQKPKEYTISADAEATLVEPTKVKIEKPAPVEEAIQEIVKESPDWTIATMRAPEKFKTAEDVRTAFENDLLLFQGRKYSVAKAKDKYNPAAWEEFKDAKVTETKAGEINLTRKKVWSEEEGRFIVPPGQLMFKRVPVEDLTPEQGVQFLGVTTPAFRKIKETREALKRLAKEDKEFAQNPVFKVTEDGHLLFKATDREYKIYPRAISEELPELIEKRIIKPGQTVRLSEGYLTRTEADIYLVDRGVTSVGEAGQNYKINVGTDNVSLMGKNIDAGKGEATIAIQPDGSLKVHSNNTNIADKDLLERYGSRVKNKNITLDFAGLQTLYENISKARTLLVDANRLEQAGIQINEIRKALKGEKTQIGKLISIPYWVGKKWDQFGKVWSVKQNAFYEQHELIADASDIFTKEVRKNLTDKVGEALFSGQERKALHYYIHESALPKLGYSAEQIKNYKEVKKEMPDVEGPKFTRPEVLLDHGYTERQILDYLTILDDLTNWQADKQALLERGLSEEDIYTRKGTGKPYTDAELKQMKLTDTEIEAYHKAREAIDFGTEKFIEKKKWQYGYYDPETTAIQKRMLDIRIKQMVKRYGAYIPLMRFGDHWIAYMNPATGEKTVVGFESQIEQVRAKNELLRENIRVEMIDMKDVRQRRQMYPYLSLSQLDSLFEAAEVNQDITEIKELRDVIKERMGDIRLTKREWIPGYFRSGKHAARTIEEYLDQTIRQFTKAKTNWLAQKEIDKIENLSLKKYSQDYLNTLNTLPRDWFVTLRQGATIYYLGWKASFGAVNLTQPFTTTLPRAHKEAGYTKGSWIWAKAYAKTSQYIAHATAHLAKKEIKTELDPDLLKALDKASRQGVTAASLMEELLTLRQGIKTLETKAAVKHNAINFLGIVGTSTEKLNRVHAFIAGWDIAKLKGKNNEQAYEFAKNFTHETQYAYGVQNMPVVVNKADHVIRGLAKSLVLFQSFGLNYIHGLNSYLRGALTPGQRVANVKGLISSVITIGTLAGLRGLPLVGLAAAVYILATGEPPDEKLREALGPEHQKDADFLIYGPVSVLTETDVSSLVGLGLWPGIEWERLLAGRGGAVRTAIGGIPEKIKRAKYFYDRGAGFWKIAGEAGPAALTNYMRGMEWEEEGVVRRLRTGEELIEVTPGEAARKKLGFTPLKVTKKYKQRERERSLVRRSKERNRKYSDMLAYALFKRDQERVKEIIQEIRSYNDGKKLEDQIIINRTTIENKIRLRAIGKGIERYPKQLRPEIIRRRLRDLYMEEEGTE